MCWSLESSLIMGSWGVIIGLYAIIRNASYRDRWQGAFILTFSLMQFPDAILWYEQKTVGIAACTSTNKILSKYVIHWILAAELIVAVIAPALVDNFMKKSYYILNFLYALGMMIPTQGCSTLTPQGHILWFGIEIRISLRVLFLIGIMWPCLFMKPFIAGLSYIAFISGVWLYSTLYTDAFGSNWCFSATFCSILLLFDPFIFGRFFPEKKQKEKKEN
ncbi:hypothetical protein M0811_05550 [Anaeramoeba ignava]|uniref:Uncharacterized protein n=1 Tax=Anaeramoeba ignava TaxID=1746090 RepID=A0A9Q0LSF8_ANAIG|nr:hypothetical protein M0811_05550 [Anaeramoeba ignava]